MKPIIIAHLYPEEMNIYGDRGNVIVLTQRLCWRGFPVKVDAVRIGDKYDLRSADIIFGGGGQDRGQSLVAEDLVARGDNFCQAADDGVVVLAICGTYQLLGHGFTTADNQEIPGISIFKAHTAASDKRLIGNVVIDTPFGRLVGFENHSGQTVLEASQNSLGEVIKGYGNNATDKREGAMANNAIGTYLHGPFLPKNPGLADEIIRRALVRKLGKVELEPLDDSLEATAAKIAQTRPR